MWRPKNWKQFQRYQGQEKGVYTLIIGKSQFKKKKTYKFHSLHGLRSVFHHDRYNHCRVRFTHVVNGCANLEGQKKLFR